MRVKNLMTEHMSALDHKNLSEHHLGEFSSGQLLRQARQASGLQITELASSLKVSVEKLEALESDDFSVFPDVVFMRALAASVCRSLDIDSTSVLALMPNGAQARLPLDQKGVNTNLSYKSRNKSFLFFVVGSAFF
jgi:cytoskeleton protein RodZ